MESFFATAVTVFSGLILLALLFVMFLGKKPAHIASLQDKHVFVTGGSSGIGFELAKLCLSKGAYVTLISKTHSKLVKAYQLLTDTMGYPANRIRFEAVDVSDAATVKSAVEGSLKWRPIDILVCNAGVGCKGRLEEVEVTQLEYLTKTNFLGCVFALHAALPHMKSRSFQTPCSVIIMGSSASLAFLADANVYTATKHALKGLADYMRIELMLSNIPVTFACPPYTETAMLDEVDKGAKSSPLISKLCFYNRSRAQTAEEVAARVMEATMRGEYLATTNAVSFMLGVLGRGSVPAETMSRAMAELLLMLPLRIVSMVWFSYAKRVLEHSRSSTSRTF